MLRSFVPLAVVALIAASPAPSATPVPARHVTVICNRAPLYVFTSGANFPSRARTFAATMGERFGLVSGPRTTLESTQYYETDVPVVEPGYARGAHYWISATCAMPV